MFPKIEVPQNGRFIMEKPIKMDDFGDTTIFGNIQVVYPRIYPPLCFKVLYIPGGLFGISDIKKYDWVICA